MFGSLGAPELIIIGLVIVLLFGVGKISGLGKELGSSIKEFRRAVKEEDAEKKEAAAQAAAIPPTQATTAPPQQQYSPPAPPPGEPKKPNVF